MYREYFLLLFCFVLNLDFAIHSLMYIWYDICVVTIYRWSQKSHKLTNMQWIRKVPNDLLCQTMSLRNELEFSIFKWIHFIICFRWCCGIHCRVEWDVWYELHYMVSDFMFSMFFSIDQCHNTLFQFLAIASSELVCEIKLQCVL